MNKKGFTLIELLAVIVILGIIMLIAVPAVSYLIEKSRKDATEHSTGLIVDAAKLYYSSKEAEDTNVSAIIKKSDKLIDYSGKVDDFTLGFNDEKEVAIVALQGKYCGYKYYDTNTVSVGTVKEGLCYINDIAINTDDFLPTSQDLTVWVHNVSEIPSTSGQTNEIRIVNGIEVTSYKVSVSEPSSPTTGTTWIKLDTTSSTNISMNNVNVPISTVKQYNGSKWVSADAYLYNGTAWTKFSNKTYTESVLNGTDPVLGTGMIPVTIADDGTVTYADTSSEWYNYTNKKWANAVILSSGTYTVGQVIPESSIQSYFVWIPRYKYKLWNTGTAAKRLNSIEIIFENKGTAASTGSTNGTYLTHPAFTTLDKNGIWVGKYEIGYLGATTAATAEVSSSDSSKIIVKPNVYSWRSNTVYNFFLASYNYNRILDSHMMKNTEWGAVTYLSHSIYGLSTEININNNSSFKTGYSALPSTNQQTYPGTSGDGATYNSTYNTEVGYLASTTGNITGIYDMSGGSWEYVAGYVSGQVGSSGFTTTTLANYNTKYFDVYSASSTTTSYNYRILGDATGEMGPFMSSVIGTWTGYNNSWYNDESVFVAAATPWFPRGGRYDRGALSGQFAFTRDAGGVYVATSSRIVVAP